MKKKNKHELDQEKNKGKTSRNDLLIRPVLHNTAPVTRKATLHYKSLFHKELKEAERTQKSIKVQRRAPFPLRGLFLSKHWLTNAGTVRLPGRGHFLLSLELVCWENDFPILVCRERFYRKSRVFFHSGNNLIHPSTYSSRGRCLLLRQLPRSSPGGPRIKHCPFLQGRTQHAQGTRQTQERSTVLSS